MCKDNASRAQNEIKTQFLISYAEAQLIFAVCSKFNASRAQNEIKRSF